MIMVGIRETVIHGPPSAKPLREESPFGLIATAGDLITRRRFCSPIRVAGGCGGARDLSCDVFTPHWTEMTYVRIRLDGQKWLE